MSKPSGQSIKNRQQIEKEIAQNETNLKQLEQHHQQMVEQFNQAVKQNEARWNQLQGANVALRALLTPTVLPPPKKT